MNQQRIIPMPISMGRRQFRPSERVLPRQKELLLSHQRAMEVLERFLHLVMRIVFCALAQLTASRIGRGFRRLAPHTITV